ncbi:TPA: hypothetical protein QB227_001489 [Pasteurella multocida]|nr:hypothetical protein [Pasteurella multocida]HDR1427028.1 hypothetical protein [Pasteurella multocida]
MAIQFSKLKRWGYHVIIAIDQLFNALIGGGADETLSSRTYRGAMLAQNPRKRWRVLYRIINAIFFDKEHCKKSYESEVSRKQYPEEFQAIDEMMVCHLTESIFLQITHDSGNAWKKGDNDVQIDEEENDLRQLIREVVDIMLASKIKNGIRHLTNEKMKEIQRQAILEILKAY